MALEATEFMDQEADPRRTILVYDRNGSNKLSRSAILWTVWHFWPVGARFAFN